MFPTSFPGADVIKQREKEQAEAEGHFQAEGHLPAGETRISSPAASLRPSLVQGVQDEQLQMHDDSEDEESPRASRQQPPQGKGEGQEAHSEHKHENDDFSSFQYWRPQPTAIIDDVP